ncbi:MAG: amidase [Pseudomonadota bacterium]
MGDLLHALTACAAVDRLRQGDLSPSELIAALEQRVEAVNPALNALPTTCFERARKRAAALEKLPPGERGGLAGLPVPIKDSYEVEGVRTTWGSLAFSDHIATRSDYCVEAIEAAGGIVYAKSNTPEFEAGANTFNEVFGATRNPWDTTRSAAGSSGGAAAAVATGMAFIAQGSDFACSVRYPAAFCNVVGLRPSPGLVPQGPNALPFQVLSVIGPLARTVEDVALGLDGLARFDRRDPLSRPASPATFRTAAMTGERPKRAAFSLDLGIARVARPVRTTVERAIAKLAAAGLAVEGAHPDLGLADGAFRTLRAFQFAALRHDVLQAERAKLKPEVVWNIEQGLKLTAAEIALAEARRAQSRRAMLTFLDTHDVLIAPAAPVEPFPVTERFVSEIDGEKLETYLDWLLLGYAVTVCGCPSISIPCGLSDNGLPVGLQIIGKPYGEGALLAAAAWCESVLGASLTRPIEPREAA